MGSRSVFGWAIASLAAIFVISGILLALAWPGVISEFQRQRTEACQKRLGRLYRAATLYCEDHGGRLPPAGLWMDALSEERLSSERYLHCSLFHPESKEYGFAMNSALGTTRLAGLKDGGRTPLFYDSANLSRNASDPFTSLPKPGRHRIEERSGNNVLYAEGKVRFQQVR